mmetsp:Transcript_5639/g.21229  ORF Transcript_5639/g.21229 Transcript_5639/m.21229 type:complete len:170 (-) Transcript_5639:460-969(-)
MPSVKIIRSLHSQRCKRRKDEKNARSSSCLSHRSVSPSYKSSSKQQQAVSSTSSTHHLSVHHPSPPSRNHRGSSSSQRSSSCSRRGGASSSQRRDPQRMFLTLKKKHIWKMKSMPHELATFKFGDQDDSYGDDYSTDHEIEDWKFYQTYFPGYENLVLEIRDVSHLRND